MATLDEKITELQNDVKAVATAIADLRTAIDNLKASGVTDAELAELEQVHADLVAAVNPPAPTI